MARAQGPNAERPTTRLINSLSHLPVLYLLYIVECYRYRTRGIGAYSAGRRAPRAGASAHVDVTRRETMYGLLRKQRPISLKDRVSVRSKAVLQLRWNAEVIAAVQEAAHFCDLEDLVAERFDEAN